MDFNNKFPEWKNEGATPPETLQTSGFKGGDKPPAAWLNWLTSLVGKCVAELQEKLHLHSADNTNPHGVTASQVGLDKVNNTPDSEKAVAFASEANESRKVKYPFTIRFKGGSAEGVDLWTYDGSTSRSVNITAAKIGAAEAQHEHTLAEVSETADRKMSYLVSAISEDGISYTATVNGVSELYDGLEITVIPSMASTQAAINLNVNGFGAKNIRAKINGYNSANSGTIAAFDKWFGEGAPITLRYVAKFDNWQTVDFSRPSASGLYGTIKEEQGGTGKTSLSEVTVGRAWHLSPNDCSNKDFNTLKTAGYYFGYTGMVNAKIPDEISVLEVIPYSNDWVLQRQTRLWDGRTFFRYLKNGDTWSDWAEIFTEKNLGYLARIAQGTYTGTGGKQKSLSFNFIPKIVIVSEITSSMTSLYTGIFANGSRDKLLFSQSASGTSAAGSDASSATWDGNTLTWGSSSGPTALNANNSTYKYVAIG